VLGKGGSGGGGDSATGTPTGTATGGTATSGASQPAKTFPPGTVIYTDDFSDNSGQWDTTTEGRFRDGFRKGTYFQEILQDPSNGVQVFAASVPRSPDTNDLGDVVVTATATKVAGSGPSGYGIACRTGGNTTSYYFVVGATGGWAIEKSGPGGQAVLSPLKSTNGKIQKGNNAPNVIQGECTGGADGTPVTHTMTVNGTKVGQVVDTPDVQVDADSPGVLSSGTIGLVSVGNKGLQVEFDDLQVKAAG
jgi:hypothetical protein